MPKAEKLIPSQYLLTVLKAKVKAPTDRVSDETTLSSSQMAPLTVSLHGEMDNRAEWASRLSIPFRKVSY